MFNIIERKEEVETQKFISEFTISLGENRNSLIGFVENYISGFDVSGYDGRHDRWWGRFKNSSVNSYYYINTI